VLVKPFQLFYMKKTLTLSIALCLSSALFAQKKSSFGVVANVGNYTMPQSKNIQEGGWGAIKYNNGPGLSYQIGLWYAYRLNAQFSLSTEVLFSRRSLSSSWRSGFSHTDSLGLPVFSEGDLIRRHATMGSLTLPIKLRYNIEEDGKTSIALGTGITFPMALRSKTVDEHGNVLYYGDERIRGLGNFSPQFNYSFGVFRQLGKATQIGIEYMFELARGADTCQLEPIYRTCCFGDCLYPDYWGYGSIMSVNMKSFSVSLRHNFLN
jgi:hypothetical protein